ncbi:MAG: HAD family hydrolase, partial [Myxococcales bacterium]|nr:HAD family hydrolase [Myxococcales bacterium]
MTAAAIYLFDIDGTLLRAGGAGTRALNQIFAARYGVSDAMAGIDCGGRTDPWIVREVFTRQLGRAATADEVDAVLDAYVPALERELAASTAFRVLPFVAVTLDGLAARGGVEVGLATGNIEAGARVKLSRAGLAGRFGFGGFGCDSADRAEL